jgi:hypothetical protein
VVCDPPMLRFLPADRCNDSGAHRAAGAAPQTVAGLPQTVYAVTICLTSDF